MHIYFKDGTDQPLNSWGMKITRDFINRGILCILVQDWEKIQKLNNSSIPLMRYQDSIPYPYQYIPEPWASFVLLNWM